ncbi:hypothetical protein K7X08_013595 [Anisodus acutangulus]|uniref:pectinesterase n=1 Tax=Anisodus acutangulus TaxID=402998 RepID=A0A9Q1LLU3_9SOLA|nr:hypothetical protein K7X08_013595 [Anisodus acutangulus]
MSYSGNLTISFSNCKPKLFLSFISSLLLISTFIEVVVGVIYSDDYQSTHAILKSSCSTTFHQELCYSTIVNNLPNFSKKVTNQKDVIELSLNITTKAVQRNYYAVNKLIKTRKGLTQREEIALHDCLETIDETLDELHEAVEDLEKYPDEKSLRQHADDLKTLISAAITNQETCLDGFSHDEADKKVRKALLKGQKHVEKLCSNALAMIKNMTDTDIQNEMKLAAGKFNRKLNEDSRMSKMVALLSTLPLLRQWERDFWPGT